MEENKKSGGRGCEGWRPIVGRGARHSHPSPPEKKAASRKKSRLRRKKTAPAEFRPEGSHHVPHSVHYIQPVSGLPQPTHSEAHLFDFAISKLRFGFASLAWSFPRYAISDGSFALGLAGGGEKDGGG